MPTAFNVRALGSTVRIELDDSLTSDEQEWIASQWHDLVVEHDSPAVATMRGGIGESDDQTRQGTVTPVIAGSVEELADRLTSTVTLTGIGELSGEALMLHASAVALDDGRVLGFVGPSGRGKTTAAQSLGAQFGYVTDETLAVQHDGTVLAYPKPLSIGDRPSHKSQTAASALGLGRAPADDLRLAAIVLLDRRPGVEQPRVEWVPLTEALADLVPQTSYFAQIDRPLRTLVELVRSTGGVRRVVYSEASTLPGLVDEILSTTHDDDAVITEIADQSRQGCDCAGRADDDAAAPGTYRRAHHVDALMVDEQVIVLRTNEVTVLDGVGPVVWLAASDATDDDLRGAALSQLPDPPEGIDPAQVVDVAVQQLVDAALLIRH